MAAPLFVLTLKDMDFSVLLVGETLSAAPLGLARTELCNRCASRLTYQHIEITQYFDRLAQPR